MAPMRRARDGRAGIVLLDPGSRRPRRAVVSSFFQGDESRHSTDEGFEGFEVF